MIGLVVFVFLVALALAAPLVAPFAPDAQFRDKLLSPPSFVGGDPRFLLGPTRSDATSSRGSSTDRASRSSSAWWWW